MRIPSLAYEPKSHEQAILHSIIVNTLPELSSPSDIPGKENFLNKAEVSPSKFFFNWIGKYLLTVC